MFELKQFRNEGKSRPLTERSGADGEWERSTFRDPDGDATT